jgi:hypothetical protein
MVDILKIDLERNICWQSANGLVTVFLISTNKS